MGLRGWLRGTAAYSESMSNVRSAERSSPDGKIPSLVAALFGLLGTTIEDITKAKLSSIELGGGKQVRREEDG